jgi:UDP-galactopyranose mutase
MDYLVFSHLRWDFVYQRPQHLLSRFAREHRVFFIEEPQFGTMQACMEVSSRKDNLRVCVPQLAEMPEQEIGDSVRSLLDRLLIDYEISDYAAWYYTPAAMSFTGHLKPRVTVYDCMDELSAFRGAPPGLREAERQLFQRADLVFTGGLSLYESKKNQHENVHAFPSSIDVKHFARSRRPQRDPEDQQAISHPRIGFAGVIDERLDTELLARVAELRPDWHLLLIGPIVKISESDLPKAANIHYLGPKPYEMLPAYLAGWDVGMLPFARNEATRFISPTKTPEYLAAGLPVISTSITDVVRSYGSEKLAEIADRPEEFVSACEHLLSEKNNPERLKRVDRHLAQNSWDHTWAGMLALIDAILAAQEARHSKRTMIVRDFRVELAEI